MALPKQQSWNVQREITTQQNQAKMKQISKKSLLKLAKRSSIILLVSLIFGWWILPLFFTIPNLSESYPEESSILYDRNHKPVHHHTRDDFVRHQRVDIEDIPKTLLQAT